MDNDKFNALYNAVKAVWEVKGYCDTIFEKGITAELLSAFGDMDNMTIAQKILYWHVLSKEPIPWGYISILTNWKHDTDGDGRATETYSFNDESKIIYESDCATGHNAVYCE